MTTTAGASKKRERKSSRVAEDDVPSAGARLACRLSLCSGARCSVSMATGASVGGAASPVFEDSPVAAAPEAQRAGADNGGAERAEPMSPASVGSAGRGTFEPAGQVRCGAVRRHAYAHAHAHTHTQTHHTLCLSHLPCQVPYAHTQTLSYTHTRTHARRQPRRLPRRSAATRKNRNPFLRHR